MAEEKPLSVAITKISTVRTQIETAVMLWFNDGDLVSINTLTAAAHQVCKRICEHLEIKVQIAYDESNVPPGQQPAFKKALRLLEGFAKHANHAGEKDPQSTIVVFPDLTFVYLLDAIELYARIEGMATHLMAAFKFRFFLEYPQLARGETREILKRPRAVFIGFLKRAESLPVIMSDFGRD